MRNEVAAFRTVPRMWCYPIMTQLRQVSATLGDWYADMVDAIGAVWTIENDQTNGDDPVTSNTFGSENTLTVGGATGKEWDFMVNFGNDGTIDWRFGDDFDGTDSFVNDFYNSYFGIDPRNDSGSMDSNGGDSITYWLGYAAGEGWWTYAQGAEGDSDDSFALGVSAELTYLWDISTAGVVEGGYANTLEQENNTNSQLEPVRGGAGFTASPEAQGIRNADGNYDNYVYYPTSIVSSSLYEDGNNNQTPFGYTDLQIRDQSQGRTAHLDEIDAGTDTYLLISDGLNNKWGMKLL